METKKKLRKFTEFEMKSLKFDEYLKYLTLENFAENGETCVIRQKNYATFPRKV